MREPQTAPDQVLFDTRGLYWVSWENVLGRRVWAEGPTLSEARRKAAIAFEEKHGTNEIVRLETRIAPDGSFWFYVLPLVITKEERERTRQDGEK
jgi:hypothetical protein